MKPQFVLSVAAAMLLAHHVQADTVYKIVGPDGRVTYTTTAPAQNQKATQLRMDVPAPEATKSVAPASAEKASTSLKKEEKTAEAPAKSPLRAMKDMFAGGVGTQQSGNKQGFGQPILFYKVIGCKDCDAARKHLNGMRIAYRGIDVSSEDGRRAMNEVDRSAKLPLLVAGGKRAQGYSADVYDEMLRDYK
jgi:glutaredoxin